MASKYRLNVSALYLPGTDIPKNRLNITDAETIRAIEQELLEEGYRVFLDELNEATCFDEQYFKSLHKRTFESLYEWAGIYRDFNMAKGDSRFCQGAFVESESRRIFEELRKLDHLRGYEDRSKEEFVRHLAYFQCELIALHPFYELNGRITRMFFDLIAAYNGYRFIDYGQVSPQAYIEASIDCVQLADCRKMGEIIAKGLSK